MTSIILQVMTLVNPNIRIMFLFMTEKMMVMSVPFIIGIIIDIQYQGISSLIGWSIWFIMFVLLLIDRHKREH